MTNRKSSQFHEMKHKEPTHCLKMLGILISLSGSTGKKFKKTRLYLEQLMIEINFKHLSSLEASLLILVYIHAKLRHLFAATAFTKFECAALDKTLPFTLLSKLGINTKTNLTIIHSSYL